MQNRVVIGIDLAGNEGNRSGFAVIKEEFGQKDIKSRAVFSDEEILEEIKRHHPTVVTIDAPLTTKNSNRPADEQLKQFYHLPSLSLPGMQTLAKRAVRLAEEIKKLNIPILEVNSKVSAQIIGVEPLSLSKSRHQADAIIAAMTGFLYLEGKTKDIGDSQGKITIPKPSRKKLVSQNQ